LLIKRDDLCGHGRGGAKARKIEALLGYMRLMGYDALVTVAGNVTNVVFDILPVLEAHQIAHHLMILDDPPMKPTDRESVFSGVLEKIHLRGASRWGVAWEAWQMARRLRKEGRRPLVVLPGIAHPASITGNAKGFLEMIRQRQEEGVALPRAVYITAATGCTLAGFLIAENALRRAGCAPIEIIGVQIYKAPIHSLTWALMRWTERHLGLQGRVPKERIQIQSAQLDKGFGHFPDAIASLCQEVEQQAQIQIDPIFGGKTWQAMLEHPQPSQETQERPLLYWHCGYTPEWPLLRQMLNAR
jgi:1-aminocyclopropane-1-carboxylate deaminase/D-cysteine desulfhydrase-like pyridoxal-dependent ACC family enzyme